MALNIDGSVFFMAQLLWTGLNIDFFFSVFSFSVFHYSI